MKLQVIGDLISLMNLSMTGELAAAFKSGAQRAGKVTEAWGADNFYCPNCSSPKLDWLKPGTKASDYKCPICGFWYQLKSQKSRIGNSVTDGAYGAMIEAIQSNRTPNFFFLHYDLATWTVRNLLLVPHFAFPPSAIIKRPPLAAKARRAGWVGCNFDLRRIPADARIEMVVTHGGGPEPARSAHQGRLTPATLIVPPHEVREKFRRIKPLKDIPITKRGWMLDILNIVRRLGKTEFTNRDVYAFERELEELHPDNRHIHDKIRQQLQNLAKTGLLIHAGRNDYHLVK